MDPQEFGAFVQTRRKELGMTQSDLAEKLHVTSKAVSRWERGVGFPDIQLLQPLADGLDITLIELMQSRRMTEDISVTEADAMMSEAMDTFQTQQNQSWKTKALLWLGNAVIFAAYLFLGYVTQRYLNHSPLLYIPMILIYSTIWIYGIPIWKAIVTGTAFPVQKQKWVSVPMTWKAWAALAAFIGGLALLLFATAKLDHNRQLHDFLAVTGLCVSLFGGVYYYQYLENHREKK